MRAPTSVDLGFVKVHKKVLAGIVASAVSEISGVSLPKDFLSSLGELMGFRVYPGIAIDIDKNNQVVVEVKICIPYGVSIADIARHTQEVIRAAIERTVEIELKDVNVNIYGIERRPQ
jgi:uncharacterized alkaline shock family protein YloU